MPQADKIRRNLYLYSSVASCSSGVELDRGKIALFGNAPGVGGRFRIVPDQGRTQHPSSMTRVIVSAAVSKSFLVSRRRLSTSAANIPKSA